MLIARLIEFNWGQNPINLNNLSKIDLSNDEDHALLLSIKLKCLNGLNQLKLVTFDNYYCKPVDKYALLKNSFLY